MAVAAHPAPVLRDDENTGIPIGLTDSTPRRAKSRRNTVTELSARAAHRTARKLTNQTAPSSPPDGR